MIIRRATQVVAGTTMPRSATPWLPRAWPEGPRESGDRAAAGMPERAKVCMGRQQSATGSHLPLEDTALLCVVAPFASSPFAHPISQSHHRASGDLFSASPDQNSPESFSVTRVACLPAQVCACTAANRGLRAMVLPENGLPPRIAKISCQLSIWDKMWKNLSCAY